jgi:hypothetical protein
MAPAKKTTFKPLSPCFIQHLHFASAIAATTWGFLRTTEQPVWSKLHLFKNSSPSSVRREPSFPEQGHDYLLAFFAQIGPLRSGTRLFKE